MDWEAKIGMACVVGFFLLLCTVIADGIHQAHRIATSPDPLATACALGKEKACTALANRKP